MMTKQSPVNGEDMAHAGGAPASYRPEIDGLRALAVLPVILFHAGLPAFAGGFVGVDVFFVISGYLITSILLKEMASGTYAIKTFYERRARRILPALFLVMFATVPFAWWYMVPAEQKIFGQSILSVLTFCSNIFFWKNTDYFSPAAEQQPLLHTWSLAVEEQYYVLFPLLLMLLWSHARRWIFTILAVMALLSLGLSEWGWRHQASANFYMLPTRAWELLLGSLLAVRVIRDSAADGPATRHHWSAPWLAGLGLAFMVGSVAFFDARTPFPSLYALVPTLGTVLVIAHGGAPGPVRSVLASPLVVRVGLISYSAYLWHQPIFGLARLIVPELLSPARMLILALASLLLANVSWRFVEQPFRHRATMPARRLWLILGVASVPLFIYGLSSSWTQGFSHAQRWQSYANVFEVQAQSGAWYQECMRRRVETLLGPVACKIGSPDVEPSGVLWGDSLAGSLIPALDLLLKEQGVAYVAVVSNGCAPLPGIKRLSYQCTESRHRQFMEIMGQSPGLKEVIWMGHFLAATTNQEYTFQGHPLGQAELLGQIKLTLDTLKTQGKKVVLVGQNPVMPTDVPGFHARQRLKGLSPELSVSRADATAFFELYDHIKALAQHEALFVDTESLLCRDGRCPSEVDSLGLLYADAGHMSHAAAALVARRALALMHP